MGMQLQNIVFNWPQMKNIRCVCVASSPSSCGVPLAVSGTSQLLVIPPGKGCNLQDHEAATGPDVGAHVTIWLFTFTVRLVFITMGVCVYYRFLAPTVPDS
eukprot:6478383-Amphidinium_carterae.2